MTLLLTLFKSNWKLIGVLFIIGSLWAFGKIQTVRLHNEQTELLKYQNIINSYKQVTEQQKNDAIVYKKNQDKITQIVTESNDYKIKKIKDYYANHPNIKLVHTIELPKQSSNSSATTEDLPTTSNGTNETSTYTPTIEDCTVTTQMLESLQIWVNDETNLCKESK